MPTILQSVFRTTSIVVLSVFWTCFVILKTFIEWWKYRGPTPYFSVQKRSRPKILDGWKHGFIQLKEIRMHYVETGESSKPLIVCVHGFPEFWYSYRFQLKYFEKDYHVVALDLRGYNETEKPSGVSSYNAESIAADIAEAIEKLGGKAIVIGHDWGGIISWILAMQYPDLIADRLIVLNSPHPKAFWKTIRTTSTQLLKSWYIFFFQCPFIPEIIIKANDFAFFDRCFRGSKGGLEHPGNLTNEDMDAWKYTFSKPNSLTPILNYYRAVMRLAGRKHFSSEPIRPKTLIIWGEKDAALEIKCAELSLLLCRDGHLEVIPDSSHWVQQDVPEKVNQLIEDFIKQ